MTHESLVAVGKRAAFTTDRDELFKRLVQDTEHGYITTEGEYGQGRTYYVTVGNLLDALKAFCDEKEGDGLMGTTLYKLSWESVSAIKHPQFYDFRTERVRRGVDPATVPDEFWHETSAETTSPWEQRNGLNQLIREGELIRNVRLFKATVEQAEWEPTS